MLYTRKGDAGTTKTFGCNQRISKSSATAEALGSLDEINSFLGLVKVKVKAAGISLILDSEVVPIEAIIHGVQENLFIIQAEVAGYPKPLDAQKITVAEKITDAVEAELPPIKTFFISGGTELAAIFDIARTMARRAERRVVAVYEELENEKASAEQKDTAADNATDTDSGRQTPTIDANTLAYLNRLSSVLYALARHANHSSGIIEESPSYS